jgi:hypothetical protein
MTHLSTEALARLVDEAPDAAEAAHLAKCIECAAEWEALREQTSLLGRLGLLSPPATGWDALCAELRDVGLVHAAPTRRPWASSALRAAAALLVVAGGAAALALRPDAAPAPLALERAEQIVLPQTGSRAPARPVPEAPEIRTERFARLEAAPSSGPASAETFRSAPAPAPPEARSASGAGTDEAHLLALAAYIESTAPPADADPVERLAAWEGIVLATGDALERAPASPEVNGYHLLALRERDSVLQQVAINTPPSWF